MSPSSSRRPTRSIETTEYIRMTVRILTGAGRRVGDGDPDDLAVLLGLRDHVDKAIVAAVRGLREAGCTWQEIGDATGTSRQAAIMKWSRGSDQVPASRRARSPRLG